MPSKSAPTLRARRAGKVTPSKSLERTRLVSNPSTDDVDEYRVPESSPIKSVIWFIVVVLLAFLAFWVIKNYINGSDDVANETPTPVPSIQEEASIVSTNVLPDDPVAPLSDTTYWNTEAKQIQATTSGVDFTVASIRVQPHNSYISVVYELAGGSLTDLPQITAEMLSDISLAIENVAANHSLLSPNEQVDVNSDSVKSLARISFEENVDSYLVGLIEEQPFTLYTKVEDGKKLVLLDVMLPKSASPTPSTVPTAGPSPTALPAGSQNMTNEFGRNQQRVVTSTNSNSARITKYNYFDAPDKFTYKLILEDAVPNATATLDGSILTLEVSNLVFDGVVGNGGSGSTDLAETGVTHVLNVNITNENGVSKYVFTLDSARDFRIFADEDDMSLTLEVKN